MDDYQVQSSKNTYVSPVTMKHEPLEIVRGSDADTSTGSSTGTGYSSPSTTTYQPPTTTDTYHPPTTTYQPPTDTYHPPASTDNDSSHSYYSTTLYSECSLYYYY